MSVWPSRLVDSAASHDLGGGALLWVFLGTQNETREVVGRWEVTLRQPGWSATLDAEHPSLKAEGRSGWFDVTALWWPAGESFAVELEPGPGSDAGIDCGASCAAAIGILAELGGDAAHYWTISDLICA